MLNKLFGKKKDKNYFLEIEEKTEQTNEISSEVSQTVSEEVTQETSQKSVSKTSVKAKSKNSVTSTPIVAKTNVATSYEQPEWVKAIKNYSNIDDSKTKEEANFATKHLLGNMPLSRRTPGPSLNSFKAMAASMKKG